MDVTFAVMSVLLFIAALLNFYQEVKIRRLNDVETDRLIVVHENENLMMKCEKMAAEIKALKSAPPPKKETLTVEAQQILHDLTAGESIVRIIPISPGDVFWRSPR